jgi:hypothetical protein
MQERVQDLKKFSAGYSKGVMQQMKMSHSWHCKRTTDATTWNATTIVWVQINNYTYIHFQTNRNARLEYRVYPQLITSLKNSICISLTFFYKRKHIYNIERWRNDNLEWNDWFGN